MIRNTIKIFLSDSNNTVYRSYLQTDYQGRATLDMMIIVC